MGYPVREYVNGYWYHVYSRGQRGEPLFFSPEDRISYLQFLDKELKRSGGAIGSFCLMTNHTHLLLRQGPVSLGNVLRNAHSKYARNFNDRRNIKGHVTQRRPGVKIILDENYLFTLVGYIHRNPLDANIVSKIFEYKWCSWYWFEDKECDWIELKSWEFPPQFIENRSELFRSIVNRDNHAWPAGKTYIGTETEWNVFSDRRQIGRDAQAYRERRGLRTMDEIAESTVKNTDYTIEDLQGPSRARALSKFRHKAMAKMHEVGHGTSDIARYFNRTPAIVTRSYKKYRDRAK